MPGSYRFTDLSFDPRSGELRGANGVTRLQPQAAAVLTLLLDSAGAVVSRADLKAKLWPDTTVEFDDGLNFCIRQLRLALGDDANAPRFIETLPKRGYRFLPTVTAESPRAETAAIAMPPDGATRRWMASAVILLALVAIAVLRGRATFRPADGKDIRTVVLALVPFGVDTTDALMNSYQQRLFAQITLDARAERAWRIVTNPGGPAPSSQDSARTFFDRLAAAGVTHVLSGSLARQGNSVRLFVRLVQVPGGRNLWADSSVDAYAFSGNSTLTADRIARSVARLLGQGEASHLDSASGRPHSP